jgi:cobalamin-dependent methionine synthase I
MKSLFFLPFVLLLGLVVGGWAPKNELQFAKKEMADLRTKLNERDKSQRFDALTRMVQIPERAKPSKATATTRSKTDSDAALHGTEPRAAERLSVTVAGPSNTTIAAASPKVPPTPEDLRARIDEAKELWMTRVEIARAQWLERLNLSQTETEAFDSALNTMNENLYAAMQHLADRVGTAEALTPEAGVRAFNEMTSVLVQTYDDLSTIIPAARQTDASKLELTDFIDPAVAEPLVAIQDKLEDLPNDRSPRARFK